MMKHFFAWLRAIVAISLIVANLIILPVLVIFLALIQKIIPIKLIRNTLYPLSHQLLPDLWVLINSFAMNIASSTSWEIIAKGETKRQGCYLLICNHQSWLDILVLERVFLGKSPMLKFFMKQELLWTLPIVGLACHLLDFPFMKRHNKEYLKKHPDQRDKDIETTRKACEIYKDKPIAIMNYVEGTRFTKEKHQARHSPYQHLLPPKAGGVALVLATMDQYIHHLIDATIIYHTESPSLLNFFLGKIPKITVHYEVLPVPKELLGDYYHDKDFRLSFQQWLNQRWQLKDQLIEEKKKEAPSHCNPPSVRRDG
jgi:1-acyl-sn-glycerol-3-phosphate acyltransferase